MSKIHLTCLVIFLSRVHLSKCVPPGTTFYDKLHVVKDEWAAMNALNATTPVLQIGVDTNRTFSYLTVGFGFVGPASQHKPPVVFGYQQTSEEGQTRGDMIFATRDTVNGTQPAIERARLKASGQFEFHKKVFLREGAYELAEASTMRHMGKIENITSSLLSLNFTFFSFVNGSAEDAPKKTGVLGDEVEKVFPDLVATDDDGRRHVRYDKLSVYAVVALKELAARISRLEAIVL